MLSLSVVLIAKNQGWNIGRLVQSVQAATHSLPAREIILVDSASSDDTVRQAAEFPITVLRLDADQPLTPAAGRYLGYCYSTGALVLFLDGDMELVADWLRQALDVMYSQPTIGGITGERFDLPKTTLPANKPIVTPRVTSQWFDVPQGGGAALYRRAVLEEVGQFNPYLYSDEEPDLCIRIRYSGYRFVRLSYPIVYHYTDPTDRISSLVGRWRRRLYLGSGQNLRYHWGDRFFWPYIRERGLGLIPGLLLLLALLGVLGSLYVQAYQWLGAVLLLITGGLMLYVLYKRSFYGAAFALMTRLLFLDGTVRGLFLKPGDPATYPAKFSIIKTVS